MRSLSRGKIKEAIISLCNATVQPKLICVNEIHCADDKNHRWRKFFELLNKRNFLAPGYAGYLCRNWNRSHSGSDRLREVEIVFMVEWTRRTSRILSRANFQLANFTARQTQEKRKMKRGLNLPGLSPLLFYPRSLISGSLLRLSSTLRCFRRHRIR